MLKSLRQFYERQVEDGVCFSIEGLASLAVRQKQPDRAVRLIAWTDASRRTMLDSRPPVEQADVDRDLAAIREMIDKETFDAAYDEGQVMTMEQVVAYALEEAGEKFFAEG